MTRNQALSLGVDELARYDAAPEVIDRLRKEWGLDALVSLAGTYCSLIYAVGDQSILKYPLDPEEATSGVRCLRAFDGHGGVKVLQHDEETGCILMERATPGTMLHEAVSDDEEETRIFAGAVRRLRYAPPADCTPLRDWYGVLRKPRVPIEHRYLDIAIGVSEELFASSPEPRLLHGDLHHHNLLQHRDGWVVIDPKGVVGDPAFESAAYLRNPIPFPSDPEMEVKLRRRIDVLADELGDDPARVWGWGFAQNVVSFVWDNWDTSSGFLRFLDAMWSLRDSYWR